MALSRTAISLELNVRRFWVSSAEGGGGGARCVRNQVSPEAAISASSPASVNGQRRAPSPGPAPRDHPLPAGEGKPLKNSVSPLPEGEGKTSKAFGSPLPWGEGLGVRGPAPTGERPESVSRFKRFRSARMSEAC